MNMKVYESISLPLYLPVQSYNTKSFLSPQCYEECCVVVLSPITYTIITIVQTGHGGFPVLIITEVDRPAIWEKKTKPGKTKAKTDLALLSAVPKMQSFFLLILHLCPNSSTALLPVRSPSPGCSACLDPTDLEVTCPVEQVSVS